MKKLASPNSPLEWRDGIKRIWEHEIKENFNGVIEEISEFIDQAKRKKHPDCCKQSR